MRTIRGKHLVVFSCFRRLFACFLVVILPQAGAQTTTGNAANGAKHFAAYSLIPFNPTGLGCVSCHVAGIARHANAINAGGHITHANAQGMGGAADPGGRYNDIAAYFATLFTAQATQSVTFGTARSITIPNLHLNTSYGDYVGIRRVSGPSRGAAVFTVGSLSVTYTPNTGQCGSDTFTYQAYRTINSGTSNTRTVSLSISNPAAPNITTSPATGAGTYNSAFSYLPISTGGPVLSYVLTGTLPAGVSLSGSTGAISGTPTQTGTFNVTLTGRNCFNGSLTGRSSAKAIAITISPASQVITFHALANKVTTSPPFTVSATGGTSGNAVTFTASGVCSSAGVNGSIITLSGVVGTCTVTASQAGNANYAAAIPVQQGFAVMPPNSFISAASRKVHGAAGSLDLTINTSVALDGAVTVESRAIGTGHVIVFKFANAVSIAGSAVVSAGTGMVTSVVAALNEVRVTVTSVPNNSRALISLSGVDGGINIAAPLGLRVGDVNGDRIVSTADVLALKAHSGQTAAGTNFKFDLDATGIISAADIAAAKARIDLTSIP